MKQRIWLKAIAVWQTGGGALGGAVFLDSVSDENESAYAALFSRVYEKVRHCAMVGIRVSAPARPLDIRWDLTNI